MNKNFKADYYRMTGAGSTNKLSVLINLLFRHNIRFMYFFRKYESRQNILVKYLLHRMNRKYGLEISCDAKIGPGLYLGHPYNITVAEGTVIGKNVVITMRMTFGAIS